MENLYKDLMSMGISQPYAHQLATGKRTPSFRLALKIQDRIKVPLKHWKISD
jgi:hypothetical protein